MDGVRAAVKVVGGKWKCEVLWHLRDGPRRFAELRRALSPITERVLSRQLRELMAEDVVARRDYGEMPLRVEYSMTEYGRSLDAILRAIGAWGTRHRERRARSSTAA